MFGSGLAVATPGVSESPPDTSTATAKVEGKEGSLESPFATSTATAKGKAVSLTAALSAPDQADVVHLLPLSPPSRPREDRFMKAASASTSSAATSLAATAGYPIGRPTWTTATTPTKEQA